MKVEACLKLIVYEFLIMLKLFSHVYSHIHTRMNELMKS